MNTEREVDQASEVKPALEVMPELEVRIPKKFFTMMIRGEITASMLLTMGLLYHWAKWDTGWVEYISAQGLTTASNDSYHRQTYKDALKRLEELGHIIRHMTLGSHKSFPVTINNFRVSYKLMNKQGEPVLKVVTKNKVKTVTYREFQQGLRPEPIPDGLPEGIPEALPEGLPEGIPRTSNTHAVDLQEKHAGVGQDSSSNEQRRTAGAAAAPPAAVNDRSKAQHERRPQVEQEEITIRDESKEPEEFENRWLAQELLKYLKNPACLQLDVLEKKFKEQFIKYPGYTNYRVAQDMIFIFENDPRDKHRKNLMSAKHPVQYLFSILEPVEDNKQAWEQQALTSAEAADGGGFGDEDDFGAVVAKTFDLDE